MQRLSTAKTMTLSKIAGATNRLLAYRTARKFWLTYSISPAQHLGSLTLLVQYPSFSHRSYCSFCSSNLALLFAPELSGTFVLLLTFNHVGMPPRSSTNKFLLTLPHVHKLDLMREILVRAWGAYFVSAFFV